MERRVFFQLDWDRKWWCVEGWRSSFLSWMHSTFKWSLFVVLVGGRRGCRLVRFRAVNSSYTMTIIFHRLLTEAFSMTQGCVALLSLDKIWSSHQVACEKALLRKRRVGKKFSQIHTHSTILVSFHISHFIKMTATLWLALGPQVELDYDKYNMLMMMRIASNRARQTCVSILTL